MAIQSIQLLYNSNCNLWTRVRETLEKILKEEKISVIPELILIKDNAEAVKYRFFGSPQININGKDMDPEAQKVINFQESGCRLYVWKEKAFEGPPEEMIREIIKKAASD